MKISPWGRIEWLLPKLSINRWHLIASSSFEDRCSAVVEAMNAREWQIDSSMLLRIENPRTELWKECAPLVEKNFEALRQTLSGSSHLHRKIELLSQPSNCCREDSLNPDGAKSVLLDISTLPKKFFLFATRKLLESKRVSNLVVTYSLAKEYTELALCQDALPPVALQGFARVDIKKGKRRMIVGVGYTALSVDEMVSLGNIKKLDYIIPFPPASPAFRRNWTLLSTLVTSDIPKSTEVHRINGMDAFEVCAKVRAWGSEDEIVMLPFGPKPQALGMALACIRIGGTAELIYSQPQAYRPDYSKGIARGVDNFPQIYAYCLKKDGRETF